MSKARAKGTAAEREVVRYLQNWWPAAERRALSGNKDRGDVAGIPNLVVEVKAASRLELAAWQRETLIERENADVDWCWLVVKRPYKSVADWDAYVPLGDIVPGESGWVRMDLRLAVVMRLTSGQAAMACGHRAHSLPSSSITASS